MGDDLCRRLFGLECFNARELTRTSNLHETSATDIERVAKCVLHGITPVRNASNLTGLIAPYEKCRDYCSIWFSSDFDDGVAAGTVADF